MKLLIEEHQYPFEIVKGLFPNIDELDVVEGKASVNYVGYYYYAAKNEAVFILPKVVLGKGDKVFGHDDITPEDIVDFDSSNNPLSEREREFIYGLSVWIYRAISVYLGDCVAKKKDHSIVRTQKVIKLGKGKRRLSNTFLDIILSLIDFNKQNKEWFMFILKNIHSGFNKINWSRTIATSEVVVQDDEPIYINPVTKKRQVNFDEELLVIFFSILNYIHEDYGFPVDINFNYDLITGKRFKRYLEKGFGVRRLRQIKYKYFSDKALQLWDLCFAFFEQSKHIRINAQLNEFLLVKNFNIVFEAIIDELIGDTSYPDKLNHKQADGKEVDHMFLWDSLTNTDANKQVYYIGDSKYYKQSNRVGPESVAKQYTYARNVIQWNLNLFFGEDADEKQRETEFCLRDEVTEGYNVIPNFFISAKLPSDLKYRDDIDKTKTRAQLHVSQQFRNRLFDRDTLLITHYDVNFLFVVKLYARDNSFQKKGWQIKVRNIFRDKIRAELAHRYNFFAMQPKPGIITREYIEQHFKDILGKVYAPFSDKSVVTLALDNGERIIRDIDKLPLEKRIIRQQQYDDLMAENERVRNLLDQAFHIVECPLGTDPFKRLEEHIAVHGQVATYAGDGLFLFGVVHKTKPGKDGRKEVSAEYMDFLNHEAKSYVMRNMPSGDISKAAHFIPMFDGGIEGYYDIERISFGSRKEVITRTEKVEVPKFENGEERLEWVLRKVPVLDEFGEHVTTSMPCLNIRLGDYHPLGDHKAEVPMYRNWNGQIHTFAEVMKLYISEQ